MNGRHRSYLSGLYLDRENGWVFGVCAGLADRFGVDLAIVRIIAFVALMFATTPTVIAYALAAWILSDRPLCHDDPDSEREFWRSQGERRGY